MDVVHAGLLTEGEARRLAAQLWSDPSPPSATPDVPWAVIGSAEGRRVAACATMWPVGIFWAIRDGRAVVGLHPRDVLLATSEEPWALDREWLLGFLRDGADPTGSPYAGMRRLLPGQTLVISAAGAVTVTDWANPADRPAPDLDGREALPRYREAFSSVLAQGIARCGPVTAEVSGGLDSTFVAASLARAQPGEVFGLTASPLPGSPAARPGWVLDDLPDAMLLAGAYPNLTISPVRNVDRRSPLDSGLAASSGSWWPGFAPTNQVWLDLVAEAARRRGSLAVWAGRNGNFCFSVQGQGTGRHHLARREWLPAVKSVLPANGVHHPRRWWRDVRRTFRAQAWNRPAALAALYGQRRPYPASSNPVSGSPVLLDPFRSRAVLDIAARMTPAAWERWPLPRGFAREAGRGVVPDGIRLRTRRGMQAADAWLWIYDRRDEYLDRVVALRDVPAIGPALAETAVVQEVTDWSWGSPDQAPPQVQLSAATRILALGDFVRLADDRLRRLASAAPTGGSASGCSGPARIPSRPPVEPESRYGGAGLVSSL